ncbi:MAG: hypothetical protein PHH70_03430 [Candidatus Gracilibacteria bacterium]|nr:hypothetical protein [Candidatus Gracilibacteria bacterium]
MWALRHSAWRLPDIVILPREDSEGIYVHVRGTFPEIPILLSSFMNVDVNHLHSTFPAEISREKIDATIMAQATVNRENQIARRLSGLPPVKSYERRLSCLSFRV